MKKAVIPAVMALFFASGVVFADSAGFRDVSPKYWASPVIQYLKDHNIISGYPDGTFKPDQPITRAEVAQMIYNEHTSIQNELQQNSSEDNVVTNTIANTLPSVVVINVGNQLGAGVFVDSTHILTAYHVINSKDGSAIMVSTLSGNQYEAQLQQGDPAKDLALLKIPVTSEKIKPIQLAPSFKVGETAIAIGHPDGLNYSVSKGIVSYADRQLDNGGAHLIQVDTAISPGNSGGPLVDINGCLIGIVDEKIAESASEGLGFAVSLEDVSGFLKMSGL